MSDGSAGGGVAEPNEAGQEGPPTKAVVAGLVIAGGVLLQGALLGSYSNGPEAIITVPLAFALTVGIGLACGALAKLSRRRITAALLALAGLAAAAWVVCALHPTDGKMKPHHFAWAVLQHWRHPEAVHYEDVYAGGPDAAPLRFVAMRQYAHALPARAIGVDYSQAGTPWDQALRYVCEERGGRWTVLDLAGRGLPLSIALVEGEAVPTLALGIDGRQWLVEYRSVLGQAPDWHAVERRWERGAAHLSAWSWRY